MGWMEIVRYLVVWTLIGALAFNAYVILFFRTGLVYAARERDGTLRRQQPLSGVLNSLLLLLLIVRLFLLSNVSLARSGFDGYSFWRFFALNYSLYLLLFLYDTYVIDYFVIARWRPAILQIQDEMNAESMGEHIRASLVAEPVIGLVLVALSAGIAALLFAG